MDGMGWRIHEKGGWIVQGVECMKMEDGWFRMQDYLMCEGMCIKRNPLLMLKETYSHSLS